MASHRPKVLILLKTQGLQYDDRIRKEATSLNALGATVHIGATEDANQAGRCEPYPGIQAHTVRLRLRRVAKSGALVGLKTAEMYARFLWLLLVVRPDVVWICNIEAAGLVPILAVLRRLGLLHRLVWDQHELWPNGVLGQVWGRRAYRLLTGMCDCIVMANAQRRDYLRTLLGGRETTPTEVLENYPDRLYAGLPEAPLPEALARWLGATTRYCLAQGGAAPGRHIRELIEAVVRHPVARLVVVGGFAQELIHELDSRHGDAWRQRVYVAGWVPQMQLPSFLDHALASVILYDGQELNTRLCAPNRLYQALARGVPVLVGANPPMRNVVEQLGCGVVLQGYGDDVEDIVGGMAAMCDGADAFRHSLSDLPKDLFAWETQLPVLDRIVNGS